MFFAAPPVTIPEPVIRERTAYYEVVGSREPDLVRELNEKGPTKAADTYWAFTDAGTSWSYDTRMHGAVCVIVKPSVVVAINTTLPHWTPPPGVDGRVVGKWNAMEKALRHHEDEHAQFARDTGKAVTALMREHPTDATCERLDAYLQARGRTLTDNASKQNLELDARTGHGSKEGVAISW
jgi:predicted secreted Zn-dependent protease